MKMETPTTQNSKTEDRKNKLCQQLEMEEGKEEEREKKKRKIAQQTLQQGTRMCAIYKYKRQCLLH